MRILDSHFFHSNLALGETAVCAEESAHIAKSFRARAGDALTLCDGKGRFSSAVLIDPNPKECIVRIEQIGEQEPPPKISLAISCLQNGEEEDIVFHAAQLPLAAIYLLRTDRSLEPRNSDLDKLRRRLCAKSLSALKQSKKAYLTEIKAPIFLNDFLSSFNGNLIVCDESGNLDLPHSTITQQTPSAVLTGPEGGFSPAELDTLKNKGSYFFSLGKTRLRAATAPIFAAFAVANFYKNITS
ncbi:ribosomal RNA small subunit methyltransferase E [Fibrobacterales bacterium]|nr:ribosomal RNA small subunit methyltransferase E [Fibrobacterales bacterium]